MLKKLGTYLLQAVVRFIDFFYPPLRKWLSLELYHYLACGCLNAVQDWLLYSFFYNIVLRRQIVDLGFFAFEPHSAALIMVTPITFFVGFSFSKYITFRGSEIKTHWQLVRYALILTINFMVSWGCIKLLVEGIGLYPTPSKMITTVITTLISFLLQKYYSFRKHGRNEQLD
ncbi:MAG: GtrA family protein [Paludibacteraceae bacterium]|nr:GtrA family protein [Paludibacteraceae bacterium]